MLATDSSPAAQAIQASGRRERSQPALRLPTEPRPESRPDARPVAQLAALVGDVIASLAAPPAGDSLRASLSRCNAELELCLEAHRAPAASPPARDELERLLGQLAGAEGTELTSVLRQLRRVLGRLDTRAS